MANQTISLNALKKILLLFTNGNSKRSISKQTKLARNTVRYYIKHFLIQQINFEDIQALNNNDLIKLFRKNKANSHTVSERNNKLIIFLLRSEKRIRNNEITQNVLWKEYLKEYPDGYRSSQFNLKFLKWCKTNGILQISSKRWRLLSIHKDDILILKKWRHSNDRRKWEKAVVLLNAYEGRSIKSIAQSIERSADKVKDWIRLYERDRLNSFNKKPRKTNKAKIEQIEIKKTNLIKLIHETPSIHGINRASWSLKTLSAAYCKVFNKSLSISTISEYIRSEGFSFKKAKKTLTSPDPDYREKLNKITSILSNLTNREKFFSVDEYGPCSIKIKGGTSLVKNGEAKTYPQRQKSKGFLICTGALELSTNQVTHFYSLKKNTYEMIKLLEILIVKYIGEERIFFSWDSASWHASKKLITKIEEINSPEYKALHATPFVVLAPLPSSAQFLNVIESVFSGLAKAIIHNSDYNSVDECKSAIDQYFAERNSYFREHPKRAGNKIWGKELVKPVFSEAHNCKDPKWR